MSDLFAMQLDKRVDRARWHCREQALRHPTRN
jgi:hypothetical protein